MASPAKIIPATPETLPADFSGWDNDDLPAKSPVDPGEIKPAPGPRAVPESPAQHANARSSVPANPEKSNNGTTSGNGPALTPAAAFAEAEDFFQTFRPSNFYIEDLEPPAKSRFNLSKKTMITAGAVASAVLLIILVALMYPRLMARTTSAKQPAAKQSAAAAQTAPAQPEMNSSAPAAKPPAAGAPASGVTAPQTPALAQSETAEVEQPASHAQPEMMNRQLTAPTLIPKAMKAAPANEAPPSAGFGANGTEGLNSNASGAIGSVFNGPGRPKVKVEAPKIVNVSAGVAVGLLLQKTAPIYPPIAKTARVSGTVVLGATISKTGSIEGLHVISGPEMLRQSAEEAVRTWRYRPYMLNNEPVAVETTVSVIFSLGQ
jgi:TonB family protein